MKVLGDKKHGREGETVTLLVMFMAMIQSFSPDGVLTAWPDMVAVELRPIDLQ
jgi:hypothetical protein